MRLKRVCERTAFLCPTRNNVAVLCPWFQALSTAGRLCAQCCGERVIFWCALWTSRPYAGAEGFDRSFRFWISHGSGNFTDSWTLNQRVLPPLWRPILQLIADHDICIFVSLYTYSYLRSNRREEWSTIRMTRRCLHVQRPCIPMVPWKRSARSLMRTGRILVQTIRCKASFIPTV